MVNKALARQREPAPLNSRRGAWQKLSIACLAWLLIHSSTAAQRSTAVDRLAPRTLVILIGGMDSDPTPAQLAGTARRGGNSGLYRLMGDIQHGSVVTEYFNWNGTRAGQLKSRAKADIGDITATIRKHVNRRCRDRIVLVGNSWGGHTAWEVCQSLYDSPQPIAIDYVIFLDPSSAGRASTARPKELPVNINRATNIYTRNIFGWRHWPREHRIENIDLGSPDSGYLKSGGPAYDASFDIDAHIAAEWDEAIHAGITQRILHVVAGKLPP